MPLLIASSFACSGVIFPAVFWPSVNNTSTLFGDVAVSATDLHKDLKRSYDLRLSKTKELVNNSNEQWIIWTLKNDEANDLSKQIAEKSKEISREAINSGTPGATVINISKDVIGGEEDVRIVLEEQEESQRKYIAQGMHNN